MKKINHLFKALADETRLRILNLLSKKAALCVCDVMQALNITQSKASRHLIYLKNAGILDDFREGVWMHYLLSDPKNRIHQYQLDCIRDCFNELEIMKGDLKRLDYWLEEKKKKQSLPIPQTG